MSEPVLMAWSGGKDSALALGRLLQDPQYHVVALLTTVTEGYERVSIHGVRRALLHAQADAVGLPLTEVTIPAVCTNSDYERHFGAALEPYATEGIHRVAFGDIFLEDVRAYREALLAKHGMQGLFSLWGESSSDLANAFIEEGFGAVTVCVDNQALGREAAGKNYDSAFLASLPPTVDPCGERGEFHTFVYRAPFFKSSIPYRLGEVILQDERFFYADLVPEGST